MCTCIFINRHTHIYIAHASCGLYKHHQHNMSPARRVWGRGSLSCCANTCLYVRCGRRDTSFLRGLDESNFIAGRIPSVGRHLQHKTQTRQPIIVLRRCSNITWRGLEPRSEASGGCWNPHPCVHSFLHLRIMCIAYRMLAGCLPCDPGAQPLPTFRPLDALESAE